MSSIIDNKHRILINNQFSEIQYCLFKLRGFKATLFLTYSSLNVKLPPLTNGNIQLAVLSEMILCTLWLRFASFGTPKHQSPHITVDRFLFAQHQRCRNTCAQQKRVYDYAFPSNRFCGLNCWCSDYGFASVFLFVSPIDKLIGGCGDGLSWLYGVDVLTV